MTKKLCIATILGAHGIRGLVKLRCHLENAEDLHNYNPLHDENGKAYTITLKNSVKGDWLAEVAGVIDRNASELLRGIDLFIDRSQLPETEDGGIYLEDLVGCEAIDKEGHKIGDVISVDNFGASDLLEIRPINGGKTYYLPLIEPYVGDIDLEQKIIVVETAEEFMA